MIGKVKTKINNKGVMRRYTKFVMHAAYKIPILFPDWINHIVKDRIEDKGSLDPVFNDDELKTTSLFDGDFIFNSCTVTTILNKRELQLLKKWIGDVAVSNLDVGRHSTIDDSSYIFGYGSHNVGFIRINEEHEYDNLNSIYLETVFIKNISITLHKFGSGLFLLMYQVGLNTKATDVLKNIEITDPVFDCELLSYNFYNKKNRVLKYISKSERSSEILRENATNVFNEIVLAQKTLNSLIGIKSENDSSVISANVCLNNSEPYFNQEVMPWKSSHIYEFKKYAGMNLVFNDNVTNGSLILPDDYMKFPFNIIYVYNKDLNLENNGYPKFHPPHTSEDIILAFSFLKIIADQLTDLAKETGGINYDRMGKVLTKKHDVYFYLSYKIGRVRKLLDAYLKSRSKLDSMYYETEVLHLIDFQINRAEELKGVISDFYKLSESRIQISNIKYNKFNSLIVLVFIVVQVVLAAIPIDWEKPDVWYSPLVSWLKSFFSFIF